MRWLALTLVILAPILWTPIAFFFVNQWRERRNPISLAIAGGCLEAVYITPALAWVYGKVGYDAFLIAFSAVEILLAVLYYWSFYVARKFTGGRRDDG